MAARQEPHWEPALRFSVFAISAYSFAGFLLSFAAFAGFLGLAGLQLLATEYHLGSSPGTVKTQSGDLTLIDVSLVENYAIPEQ